MDQQTPLQRALIALEVLGFVALAFVGKAVLMTVAWHELDSNLSLRVSIKLMVTKA